MNFFVFLKEYTINNSSISVSVIEISEISEELKKEIDKNLTIICQRNINGDIEILKKRLQKIIQSKTLNTQMGLIAEFFVHLSLKLLNYKQEGLFLNLEEGQIKKGFDGLYTKNNEEWIMESKSGSITTQNITHKTKLKEALKDLEQKFSGGSNNNPWTNAANHAAVLKPINENLIQVIERYSDDFTNGIFYKINDFNIIPSATIFLNNVWNPNKKEEIFEDINLLMNSISFKKAHIICISQKSIDLFKKYLGMSE